MSLDPHGNTFSQILGAIETLQAQSSGGVAATTAAITQVTAAAVSAQLAAASTSRVALSIYNGGSTNLLLAISTAPASSTNYTIPIEPGGYWEAPPGCAGLAMQGIWEGSPTGAAQVTMASYGI